MIDRILSNLGSLHRKVGAMTAARAISTIAALVVMIFLTRILDPADYGAYKKLWLIFLIFSPAITNMLVKTLYYRGEITDRGIAIWTNLTAGTVLSGIITLMVAGGGHILAELVQSPEIASALRWFSLYIFFATFSSLAEPVFVLAQRKKWLVGYSFGYNIIEACLIIIPFYLGYPLETVALIMVGGPVLRTFCLIYIARKTATVPVFSEITKELPASLSYAFGVLMIFITGIGIAQIDKLIIATWFESDELYAIYVVGAQTIPVIPAFISSVSSAIVVQYAAQISRKELSPAVDAIKSATSRLYLIVTPIVVVCFFLAEPIMVVLFDQYAESAPIFRIYVLTTMYKLFLADAFLLASGKTRVLTAFNAAEIVFNIPLSIFLIQYFGILGPALATLIAHFTAVIALILYVSKTENIKSSAFLPSKNIWPLLVSLPALGAVSWMLLTSGLPYIIMVGIGGSLCAIIIAIHNRKFVT